MDTPLAEHGQMGLRRDIVELMVELEEKHHQDGWDNTQPTLYYVMRTSSGYAVRPVPLNFVGMHPRAQLVALGTALTNPLLPASVARLMYPHPPVAHILVMEVWTRDMRVIDVTDVAGTLAQWDAERAGRSLADIVGSYEARHAMAIVGAQYLLVRRIRGQEPRFMTWRRGEVEFGGAERNVIGAALATIGKAAPDVYLKGCSSM